MVWTVMQQDYKIILKSKIVINTKIQKSCEENFHVEAPPILATRSETQYQ